MPVDLPLLFESVFGTSPEVSVRVVAPEIGPWFITIIVKEHLTNKLIEGATVKIYEEVLTTDATGSATFTLTTGRYPIIITKSGYLTSSTFIEVSEDATIEKRILNLTHLIAGGLAAAFGIIGTGALLLRRR